MKYVLLSLLLLSVPSIAQKKIPDPRKFGESITEADLKKHLYIVAGKEMEGRETATAGQRKAAAYIESQFKSLGLTPGNKSNYQLPYPLYRDSLATSSMIINGKELTLLKDFRPSLTFSNSGVMNFSEIMFVGYGVVDSVYNSYGEENVTGKAVFILDKAPEGFKGNRAAFLASTYGKVINAQQKGAAAVIIVQENILQARTGSMYESIFKGTQFPTTYYVTEKTAELLTGKPISALKETANAKKPVPVKVELQLELNEITQKLESTNVLGVLEGTDKKNEYLLITAHYDHMGKQGALIYYGADDDGSGTVSVIEIAEAFVKAKAAGKGPRRSVIFMTVSGEEEGLWGSKFYADHPTVNPDLITADLNIDMIGRINLDRKLADSLNYVYVVGDDKLSSELKPLNEAINAKYTKLGLDYKYNDPKDPERIFYRSDHYSFASIGIPIIFYTDGMDRPDYHQPTDTPERINYKLLMKRAQLVFYTAWEMANREKMLKRDIPLPKLE